MGADRTGSVSELTNLASECGCNILDSRMAIFGHEFSFIMLLQGEARSINQIEAKLPMLAHSLDLLTMMKRTSGYKSLPPSKHFIAEYSGIDQPGILKAVTSFFARHNIDISSLKSDINPETNIMSAVIEFTLNDSIEIEELETNFLELCEQFDVQGCIKQIIHQA